jgi:hypothetical protein
MKPSNFLRVARDVLEAIIVHVSVYSNLYGNKFNVAKSFQHSPHAGIIFLYTLMKCSFPLMDGRVDRYILGASLQGALNL